MKARSWFVATVEVVAVCLCCVGSAQTARKTAVALEPNTPIDVTVSEGTSMAVAVSPDGKTLAIGSAGEHLDAAFDWRSSEARHRTCSTTRDSRSGRRMENGLRFLGIWMAAMTFGRSPRMAAISISSRGAPSTIASLCTRTTARYIAFASDRDNPLGSSYNIWTLDLAHRRR